MATINLGAIKFNWKGAYNNGTTYAVDDVVSSGGNSYVCIQASTGNAVGNATAYWNIMSSAGTNGSNGTDVGTTITTQGDLLYRDGSGLQRLAKGTAGKVLKMNSGANAPEWGTDVGGKIGQVIHSSHNGVQQQSNINSADHSTNFTVSITPSATNSKILVFGHVTLAPESGYGGYGIFFKRTTGGVTTTVGTATGGGNAQKNYHSQVHNPNGGGSADSAPFSFEDSPSSTANTEYRLYIRGVGGTGNIRIGGNTDTTQKFITPLTAMEILA